MIETMIGIAVRWCWENDDVENDDDDNGVDDEDGDAAPVRE